MRGVTRFFWMEGRINLLTCLILGFLLGWLLTFPIAPMSTGIIAFVSEQPMIQKLLSAMMGSELDGPLTLRLLIGSSWSHPFVLMLVWSYVMLGSSRFPAQFVENGSIDWLMSQPLSRRSILFAQTVQVLLGLSLIVLSLTLGIYVGCRDLGSEAPAFHELALVGGNLFLTGVFFLGFSSLVSCLSSQRMRVLGLVSAFMLWNLLLGFLKPFWVVAKTLAPLSLLNYFRPGEVLRAGQIGVLSTTILLVGGLALWFLASRLLSKRDLA